MEYDIEPTGVNAMPRLDNVPTSTKPNRRPKLKGIALPVEHGSWGLVFEPILLGLLVAPSWGGFWIALGAFAAFLFRQPFKVMIIDWRRKRTTRATLALRFVTLYGFLGSVSFMIAIGLVGWQPLLPFLVALPLLAIFMWYDFHNQSRSWQAELAGPTAFSLVAVNIALADGWVWLTAWPLAVVLIGRAIPSVMYIRARLRLDKGKPHNPPWVITLHIIALLIIIALSGFMLLPPFTALAFVVLLGRAIYGLSPYRPHMSIKAIGFLEMALGIFTILMVVVGYI